LSIAERVHAHPKAGGAHSGQADHPGGGEDRAAAASTVVVAKDRLGAVHERGQIHVLGQHRRSPVRRTDRDQRARVAGLGRRGEPPLLVHQVQGQHTVEANARSLGDAAHLLEQVRGVALDRRHEARRLQEGRDERLRRPPQPGGDIGVPGLEQPADRLPQRLAVGAAALAAVPAALDHRVRRDRHPHRS
jgi:hypothetical protein